MRMFERVVACAATSATRGALLIRDGARCEDMLRDARYAR